MLFQFITKYIFRFIYIKPYNTRQRMSEAETVRSILIQARQIRQRSRTSCVPLQNLLLYQQLTLESKALSILSCSLCSRPKSETSKQFRRAFKTMSRTQQAEYYLMMVKNVQKFLNLQQKNGSQQYLNKEIACQQIMKMRFEAKDGLILKRFAQVDAEIARKEKTIRFIQLKEGIDLHAYLLRKSRGKLKNCIVLQSTQAYTPTETIRLCFNGIDFQDSFNVIYHLWQQAQYENIAKILIEDNRYPRRSTGKIGTIRSTIQMNQFDPITSRLTDNKLSLPNEKMLKSAITTTQGFPSSSKRLQKIQSNLVSPQLLQSLNTFSGLHKKSFNIYSDKEQKKVRKIFELGSKQTTIDKILESIDEIKQIRRRKQNIHEIKLLNSIPSERTNLYREIDEIGNKLYQFIYLRHQFRKNGYVYFFQKSIQLDDFKNKDQVTVVGKINYCIWRVRLIGEKIQVLVQADIQYGGKVKDVYRVSSEYIGQFSRFLKKELEQQKNSKQQQNEQISIQSSEFENQYLSEISNQQQFFTVTGSLNSSQKDPPQNQNILDQQLLLNPIPIPHHNYPSPHSLPHHQKLIQQLTSKQTAEQTLQQNTDSYLRVQHQLYPQNKGIPNYMKQSEGHLLFGSQWIINQNGQLVNINKEKIKVQSSVLKLVLQRMGKNLLSGKSIMNMSLPIQIFGTDSNLQRIARGYIYAPIFLQKAANTKNPVQRLTNIFCFGLGFSTSYIRMQKPFNPVLGQTYQGVIDGCPVYAEQISHHPPISSMLMIGRGYKVHGNFQAKVQMGLNSASGINEGFNTVQFQDGGVVRFNTPPGEIQGIIMGDRKLTLIKKSYYIDKKNRLLLQIIWGKKKSNPRPNSNLNDFFSGKILRISNTQKLDDFKNIKNKDIEQELGQIYGRFTGKVYFEDQLVFDLDHDPPFHIQDYGLCLQSDSRLRSDIIQRKRNDFNAAQDAKEEIEEAQRRDRKLRKQRHINN